MHARLEWKTAQKVLTDIEAVFNGDPGHDSEVGVIDEVYPTISFSKLKAEFVKVCQDLDLPVDIFQDGVWNPFVHQLLHVISDCPLVMPAGKNSLINQFSYLSPLDEDHIEFQVQLNNGICTSGTTNFIYIEDKGY